MKKMILMIFILCRFLSADSTSFVALPFLQIPIGAESSALAGAGVAKGGVDSLFNNPAGLTEVDQFELSIHHLEFIQQVRYENLALAFRPHPSFVLGAAFGLLHTADLRHTEEAVNPSGYIDLGSFSFYDAFLLSSCSVMLSPGFSFGVNARFITENIGDFSASTVSVDSGLRIVPSSWRFVSLGVSVSHLGLPLQLSTVKESLPSQVQTGFLVDSDTLFQNITFRWALDGRQDFSGGFSMMSGLETSFFSVGIIRVGYLLDLTGPSSSLFTFGAGILWLNFKVDYSGSLYSKLGLSHGISLGMRF